VVHDGAKFGKVKNHQMKAILVPCDFSLPSIEAFKFAVSMAEKSQGTVHLLHVVELPALYDSGAVLAFEKAYMADRKKAVEYDFQKMRNKWAKDLPIKIKTYVEYGVAVPVIRRMIRTTKCDLVVLGTHGATGLKDFTIGSNTEKIVRSSPVPVLSIKKAMKTVRNIVVPTLPDFDLEPLMMEIKELQAFFGATMHVLYVNTPVMFRTDSSVKPTLKEFAKRFMLKNYTLNTCNAMTQEEGIAAFAAESKADMIAMRTHGRRGIAHLAMGSIAEDVVNHIDCAIWTYVVK